MNRWKLVAFGVLVSTSLSMLFALAGPPADLFLQCRSNEVLVGEDADNYYCKEKKAYAACIKSAGEALGASNPACFSKYQQCFIDEKWGLATAAVSCAVGCLGSKLNAGSCLAVCGVAGIYPTKVIQRCTEVADACFGDALIAHRRRVDACKQ